MTVDPTTDGDPDAREAAIELLKEGEATVSDAASLAGVDRQLVHYWAKVAGIDVTAVREERLARRWRRLLDKVKRRASPKRPSKAEMRELGERAVAEFNKRRRRCK